MLPTQREIATLFAQRAAFLASPARPAEVLVVRGAKLHSLYQFRGAPPAFQAIRFDGTLLTLTDGEETIAVDLGEEPSPGLRGILFNASPIEDLSRKASQALIQIALPPSLPQKVWLSIFGDAVEPAASADWPAIEGEDGLLALSAPIHQVESFSFNSTHPPSFIQGSMEILHGERLALASILGLPDASAFSVARSGELLLIRPTDGKGKGKTFHLPLAALFEDDHGQLDNVRKIFITNGRGAYGFFPGPIAL